MRFPGDPLVAIKTVDPRALQAAGCEKSRRHGIRIAEYSWSVINSIFDTATFKRRPSLGTHLPKRAQRLGTGWAVSCSEMLSWLKNPSARKGLVIMFAVPEI